MESLLVFAAMLLIQLAATAFAMAAAARRVGSPRGRFGPAAGAAAILFVIQVAFAAAALGLAGWLTTADPANPPPRPLFSGLVWAGGLTSLELLSLFAVVRHTFRLSIPRVFAPFAAMLAVSIAAVVLAFAVVRPYLVEAFVLPSQSMSPTLLPGDRIAAVKLGRPRRWDVVVYHSSPRPGAPVYCHRVIALPGERLAFDGRGGVTIDGRPVAAPAAIAGRCHAVPAVAPAYLAKYADGQTITLTDRQLFLIGDNVDRAFDSRMAGPIDASAVIGVADLTYWPPARVRVMGR